MNEWPYARAVGNIEKPAPPRETMRAPAAEPRTIGGRAQAAQTALRLHRPALSPDRPRQ